MKRKTKEWLMAAGIRALKTFGQSAVAGITVGAVIWDIDWKYLLGVALTAGVYSIVTSLAGLPEVDDTEVYDMTGGKK